MGQYGLVVLALADTGSDNMVGPPHPRDRPVAVYGTVLLGSAIAYFVLTRTLLALHAPDSQLAVALGKDRKGKLSAVVYVMGIGLTFAAPWAALAVYIAVAVVWLVPDRRIERVTSVRSDEDV